MPHASDLFASMPCKDERLAPAVREALQDYAVIITAADGNRSELERAVEQKAAPRQIPILIVDDGPVVQQAAPAVLRSTGYGIALADNGRQAVFRRHHGRFALVLLDLTAGYGKARRRSAS
jgi:hypothetical protein